MVATRRGARTGPADEPANPEGPGLSLRKKPIRRATATKAAPAKPSTRALSKDVRPTEDQQLSTPARSTRSRIAACGANKREEALPDEPAKQDVIAKPNKDTGTRSRKPQKTGDQPDAETSASAQLPEQTKPARTTRQQSATIDAPQPLTGEQPLRDSEPIARRVRAARAAKPAPQPLSPKKVSQVSRFRARSTTRTAEKKSELSKAHVAFAAPTPRRGAKRRAESNENAEVLEGLQLENDFSEAAMLSSTPARTKSTRATSAKPNVPVESDGPTSSRAPTPPDSPISELKETHDHTEDEPCTESGSGEEELEEGLEVESSSIGAAEGASEDELCGPKTPMRRVSLNTESRFEGSPQESPEAQRSTPAGKSDVPRPQRRAPQTPKSHSQAVVTESAETVPPLSALVPPEIERTVEVDAAESTPEASSDQVNSSAVVIKEDVAQPVDCEDNLVASPEDSIVAEVDDSMSPGRRSFDPNATIEVEGDTELRPGSSVPGSPESENSIIITRDADTAEEEQHEDEEADYTRLTITAKTPRPETIPWHSLQPHSSIPVDFGLHQSPQIDRSQLGIMPDLNFSSPEGPSIGDHSEHDPNGYDEPSFNFTEFVDIPSNAEPTATQRMDEQLELGAGDGIPTTQEFPDLETVQTSNAPQVDTAVPAPDHSGQAMVDEDAESMPLEPPTESSLSDDKGRAEFVEETPHHMQSNKSPLSAGEVQVELVEETPHYMQPTLAFDARRKSLPALGFQTPFKSDGRPKTSVGASLPRLPRQSEDAWRTRFESPSKVETPVASPARGRRSLAPFALPAKDPATPQAPMIPLSPKVTPKQLASRLSPRRNQKEQAKTAMPPSRFRTPALIPAKRPATTRKITTVRQIALNDSAPLVISTPARNPLRLTSMTPAQVAMTPHPALPLRGVVAIVEVFTLEGGSASAPFVHLLHRLGAKTTKIWGDRVTHVIFKDGSPTTLQRIRQHNKKFRETGSGNTIHCVNSRWVSDCDAEGIRVDESDEAYVIDTDEVPRGGKRRRKSMEPAALINVGGSVVRDRMSSSGRTSFGSTLISRTPLKRDQPTEQDRSIGQATPAAMKAGRELDAEDGSSPATPAWIAAPNKLVQATAPLKRVRRLDLKGKEISHNRRRTLWNGP